MKSRTLDGRFRNHNQPLVLTENTLRSRWLEGEVLRLKRVGFSYEMIAQQITEVGRGQRPPLIPSLRTSTSRRTIRLPRWGAIRPSSEPLSEPRRWPPMRCGDWIPIGARTCSSLCRLASGKAIHNRYEPRFKCLR
jgi:hypothetical protein